MSVWVCVGVGVRRGERSKREGEKEVKERYRHKQIDRDIHTDRQNGAWKRENKSEWEEKDWEERLERRQSNKKNIALNLEKVPLEYVSW